MQSDLARSQLIECFQLSNADDSDLDSSPSTPRNAQTGEEAAAAGSSASPLLPAHAAKKKSGGKLHFAFNLLKSVRSDNNDECSSDVETNDDEKSQNGSTAHEERRARSSIGQRPQSKIVPLRQKSAEFMDECQGLRVLNNFVPRCITMTELLCGAETDMEV
ncbi:unnamed protein product [Gongylonema pulchrum]|uniref:PDE4_UCR domain-containing protein n=1 Tax=Gongylonema pulchrum TaxID=637853 RepID=A0A183EU61_9BILA|nr:unnamed protein product [Gongylonema pulchrum]